MMGRVGSREPVMAKYRSFIITMKDREDHAKAILDRLRDFGSYATIVEAVDGQSISDEAFIRLVGRRVNCLKSKRLMSKGELGCWLSHKKAWRELGKETADFAFIFEDDVIIMDDLTPIANALERLDGWDIVKLYRKKTRRPLFKRQIGNGLALTASFSASSGTFAYAIRREVAERLYESHEEYQSPIDVAFRFRSRNRIRVLDCSEDLVIHDPNSSSTIEPHRSHRRTQLKEEGRVWKLLCNAVHFFSALYDNSKYFLFGEYRSVKS